jgi:hypothetical protein
MASPNNHRLRLPIPQRRLLHPHEPRAAESECHGFVDRLGVPGAIQTHRALASSHPLTLNLELEYEWLPGQLAHRQRLLRHSVGSRAVAGNDAYLHCHLPTKSEQKSGEATLPRWMMNLLWFGQPTLRLPQYKKLRRKRLRFGFEVA